MGAGDAICRNTTGKRSVRELEKGKQKAGEGGSPTLTNKRS